MKRSKLGKSYKAGIIAIVALTGLVVLGGSTVYAADSANPGEALYPVDKASESVRRFFTIGEVNKAEYELQIMDERVDELNDLSKNGNNEDIANAVKEMDQQRIRLQERLQELEQLRTQDKIQTEDQQKIMEKLQDRLQTHERILNEVQTNLQQNGNTNSSDSVENEQVQHMEELQNEIKNFEDSSGVKVQENEKNEGDNTEIQNQNQTQNGR